MIAYDSKLQFIESDKTNESEYKIENNGPP